MTNFEVRAQKKKLKADCSVRYYRMTIKADFTDQKQLLFVQNVKNYIYFTKTFEHRALQV